MKVETDLKRIEQLGEENDDENWAFRSFLKQLDISQFDLDSMVHQITDNVSSQIDCTVCGNCCKQSTPVLDLPDMSDFASGLNMSVSDFQGNYIKLHVDNSSDYEFNALPCPFLHDNQCSNYDHRPKDCQSYPHLYKDNFISRLISVVGNYSICPIVFNVYERLKTELWEDDDLDDIDDLWF